MYEVRRINAKDGSFIIVYLEDGSSTQSARTDVGCAT